jgi:hypothetical protein
MAEKPKPSDPQILHGTVSDSLNLLADLLICLAQACSVRPATALHKTASVIIAEGSGPSN